MFISVSIVNHQMMDETQINRQWGHCRRIAGAHSHAMPYCLLKLYLIMLMYKTEPTLLHCQVWAIANNWSLNVTALIQPIFWKWTTWITIWIHLDVTTLHLLFFSKAIEMEGFQSINIAFQVTNKMLSSSAAGSEFRLSRMAVVGCLWTEKETHRASIIIQI